MGTDFLAFVRKIFPGVDADLANHLLWDCTAYPFSSDLTLLETQLREAKKEGGGTAKGAISWAKKQDL